MKRIITGVLSVYEDVKAGIASFLKWKKGNYEDKVDEAVDRISIKRMSNIMRYIRKKRNDRQKRT